MWHPAPEMSKKGGATLLHPTFSHSSSWEKSWHHCLCCLCAVCSKHAQRTGFVYSFTRSSFLPSLLTLLSGHLCTEWCHGHCVSMAIASDMLYLCANYSHQEGGRGEHIFSCLKGEWQLQTTVPAFSVYFRKHVRAEGSLTHMSV